MDTTTGNSARVFSHQYKADDLILNYHDAVIYGRDLALLERRTEWLNDSCILFYFTYLRQQHHQQQKQHEAAVRSACLFMDPAAVSFWMHQCTDQDDIDDFVSNTPFPSQDTGGGTIFIPINDHHGVAASWEKPGGGAHWSLLVVQVPRMKKNDEKGGADRDRSAVQYWHFDSSSSPSGLDSRNLRAAQDVAQRLEDCVYGNNGSSGGNTKYNEKSAVGVKPVTVKVHSAQTPQQTNGYDCGVHVLGAARVISSCRSVDNVDDDNDNNDDDDSNSVCAIWESKLMAAFGRDPAAFCAALRQKVASEIRRLAQRQKAVDD